MISDNAVIPSGIVPTRKLFDKSKYLQSRMISVRITCELENRQMIYQK